MTAKFVAAWCLAIAWAAGSAIAQSPAPAAPLNRNPLTEEQKAVYRAVLSEAIGEKVAQVNLSTRTVLMEKSGPSSDEQCRKEMEMEQAATAVHRFRSADFAELKMKVTLIDPERGGRGRNSALGRASREATTAFDDAPTSDYAQGMMVLSEILFDKKHEHAIVSYRFDCGEVCGHGETLVLSKTKSGWKRTGGCASWMD